MDLKDYIVKKKLSNVGEDGRVDGKLSTEDFVHISDSAKETEHVYPTDYAVASGIMLSPKSHGKDERKRAWAWLRDGTTNVSNYSSGLNMGLIADTVDRRDGCIQPVLSLDVQKVMGAMARGEKVISIIGKDKFVDEKYVGLSFGSMPQTFVGKEMSESFDDLARDKTIKPNGKEYFGGLDSEGKPIYNKECDYMDKKYVRVSMKNHDYDSEFADGTMIRSGSGVWFEVEPIIWKVKNWKEMPKAINPKGNGKAETIDLVAREGVVGGIPFYPNTLDADRTSWKNSSIRGYLNGLVNADSGDFRKCNFLNEAFEPEIQKQNAKPKQSVASTVQKMTEENKEKKMRFVDFIVPKTIEDKINGQKVINNDLIYLDDEESVKGIEYYLRRCSASDYATLNGAYISDTISRYSCNYFLRSIGFYGVDVKKVGDNGDIDTESVTSWENCIRPSMQLDIEKVIKAQKEMSDPFKIAKIEGGDSGQLDFGEYPQSYVGDKINADMENVYRRGQVKQTYKKYLLGYHMDDSNEKLVTDYAQELEYEGEKYVRILCKNYDEGASFKNGDDIPRPQKPCWVKVEPITWKIRNWNGLPKELNPNGNGTAKVIDIQTKDAIASEISFYPIEDDNNNLWQNSTIRGYLNGIDVRNIKTNGNPEFSAPNGGDFRGQGFIKEAGLDKELDMALNKNNKVSEDIMEHVQRKPRKGYGITIEEKPMSIDDQLKFYINAGESFMLHGPSGVGKTKRIEEIDPDFVAIVLRNGILPEEVIGKNIYPNIETTNGGKWVPPSWYVDLCEKCKEEPKKNHVLFIDEITNVKPYEQSLVYHLVLNNSIGPNYGKLPNNAVVVAAGNSMEESASAYNMPEPLFRRFSGHVYLPLDIPSWLEWGSKMVKDGKEEHQKIHPLVSNFVATFGEKVFHTDYDAEEPPKYAIDPRGWEQISDIIYKSNGRISKELIENKLGDDIAKPFMAFASKPPLLAEDIVDGNYSEDDIPEQFDEMYALVLSLRYVSKEDLSVVRTFVEEKLGGEMLVQFDKVWVNGDAERAIYLNIIKKQAPKEQSKSKKEKTATEEDKTIEPSESLNGKNGYSDLLVDITPKGLANLYSICRKVLKDAMDGEVELEYVPKALYTHIEENKWPVLIVMMEEQGVFESVENTLKFINVVIDAAKGKVKSEDQGMRR